MPTAKKKIPHIPLSSSRKEELEMQIFDNFIKLTEVQFEQTSNSKTSPRYFDDYIDPRLIQFFEVITEKGEVLTNLHFPIGSQKCKAYIKETPAEIDYLKTRFFEKRKRHGSKVGES